MREFGEETGGRINVGRKGAEVYTNGAEIQNRILADKLEGEDAKNFSV